MGEIIVIQVGACGNQVGASFWGALCAEHGITPGGTYQGSNQEQLQHIDVFFNNHHDRYVPRAVLVDLELDPLDEIRRSAQYGQLFKPNNYVFEMGGAEKIWAKGYYTEGMELLSNTMECVQNEVAGCQNLQGFILIHSLGGGTGSGMGSLLVSTLREEFPEQSIATFSVFPSTKISSSVLEPYNTVLSVRQLMELANLVLCLDNEALYDFCVRSGQAAPTHADLNRVIVGALSRFTAPLRLPASSSAPVESLQDLIGRLVPAQGAQRHFVAAGADDPSRASVPTMLRRVGQQFAAMFQMSENFHFYTGEGMDESEFTEAQAALNELIARYA
jgi:tubulin beta